MRKASPSNGGGAARPRTGGPTGSYTPKAAMPRPSGSGQGQAHAAVVYVPPVMLPFEVHDEVPVPMLSASLAAGNPAALLLDVQLRKHQAEWLKNVAAHGVHGQ